MGTIRDKDHIDSLHQQLLHIGRELEGLGHEHIVITVLQDQLSVFSSGKGRIYLEGHWQFVTEFVSFCGDNVRSKDEVEHSSQPNCSKESNAVLCATGTYKDFDEHTMAGNDGDANIMNKTEEHRAFESGDDDSQIETGDGACLSESMVLENDTETKDNTKTSNGCESTKKVNKSSRKRKNNLDSAKLLKNKVTLEDIKKLKDGGKHSRTNRNKIRDESAADGSEDNFANASVKSEPQEILKSDLGSQNEHVCSLCKKQFDVVSELTAHNQEHIDNEGCLACQLCDNRLFRFEWQLGEHMERDHNKSSSIQEGNFTCLECGYIFKYQNHLDEHHQILTDCKNIKPGKIQKKEFLNSETSFPDPKSGEIKTRKWKELLSRSKFPARCEICGKSFKICQQYRRHVWTHIDFRAFTCFICGKSFKFDEVLQKHLKVHDERPFHCQHCHFKFDTESRWEHHVKMTCTKLKDKPDLICKDCGRQFTSEYNLKDHELVYHSEEMPSYACDLCPYMAQTKQKLSRHKRLSHQEDLPFKCDQCELVFAQNMALLIHMKTHDEKKFECKKCGQKLVSESNLEQHMKKIHEEKRVFRCDQCSAVFYRPSRLRDHLNRHTGVKPWICETCGVSFYKKWRLTEHIRTHTKEKPFPCSECGKFFSTLMGLRVHRVTHNQDQCYVCDKCGQTFKNTNSLTAHRRRHTGKNTWPCMYCEHQSQSVKSYKTHLIKNHPDQKEDIEHRTTIRLHSCELCQKLYTDTTSLHRHHLIHQGLKPYPCSYCGKSFNDKSNLRCHERSHTGEGMDCKYCAKKFIQPWTLRLHLQKVHGQALDKNEVLVEHVKTSSYDETVSAVNDIAELSTFKVN